jgi:uncharacterized membrane protein
MSNVRNSSLDLMRGVAIIMMVAFHFIYDLNSFGFTQIPLFTHWSGIAWRCLIVFLFLSAVGISLVFAHSKGIQYKKFLRRLLYLGIAALLVSIGTYIMFPDGWVYFGILHLIWASTLIALAFINHPKTSLLIALLILIGFIFDQPNLGFLSNIFESYLPIGSVDYYPLFPWMSFIFIGIFLGHNPYYQKVFTFRSSWIEMMGRHALIIYLTHQIVLFGLVAAAYYLLN